MSRAASSPLFWYYAIALVIPLANASWIDSAGFFEHALFVVIVPLALLAAAALLRAGVRTAVNVGKQLRPVSTRSPPASTGR